MYIYIYVYIFTYKQVVRANDLYIQQTLYIRCTDHYIPFMCRS